MNPDQEPATSPQPNLQHPESPLNTVPQSVSPQQTTPSPQSLPPVAQPSSEAAPAAAEQHDYAHPIADSAPKKTYNPKRFIVILGAVVAVCILSVAAMLAFALLPPTTSKKTTQTTTTSTPKETTVSAKTAIDHVKEYFKATDVAKSPITRPVLSTGNQFYTVIPDVAPLVSVAGEVAPDKSDTQLNAITHSFEGDSFTQRIVNNGAENTSYLADFTRTETYCQVAITKPTDAKSNQWFEVRCLDMAQYVDYANAQEPLVSLYTPLSATSVLYGFVGKPAPVASKTANYKLAELEVSIVVDNSMTSAGKYALFYQSPDGLWHYFRDRDAAQAFDCDEYKTDELKNAYLGVACRDTGKNTMTTVEAPKKKS